MSARSSGLGVVGGTLQVQESGRIRWDLEMQTVSSLSRRSKGGDIDPTSLFGKTVTVTYVRTAFGMKNCSGGHL